MLEGPRARAGRKSIDKPENRRWWKEVYAYNSDGARFKPHPTDTDVCWFFARGASAKITHLGRTKSIRSFMYAHYVEPYDAYDFVVISGECNKDCINPKHESLVDRREYLGILASRAAKKRKNDTSTMKDRVYVDRLGDTVVVGHEAARRYWSLLVDGRIMDIWDWEKDIHVWNDQDWPLRKPENALLESMLLQMFRDPGWTASIVRKYALIELDLNKMVVAERNWREFHERLRAFG